MTETPGDENPNHTSGNGDPAHRFSRHRRRLSGRHVRKHITVALEQFKFDPLEEGDSCAGNSLAIVRHVEDTCWTTS